MPDVTLLLDAAAAGDRQAAADLLPLVYDELRKLAAARMAAEAPDQTLQPTALVHEAYLRMVGPADQARWENRGHFFAAAAEAMRRILVESARRKKAIKHGGGLHRLDATVAITAPEVDEDLVAIDEALDRLAAARSHQSRAGETSLFRRVNHRAGRPNARNLGRNCQEVLDLQPNLVVSASRRW